MPEAILRLPPSLSPAYISPRDWLTLRVTGAALQDQCYSPVVESLPELYKDWPLGTSRKKDIVSLTIPSLPHCQAGALSSVFLLCFALWSLQKQVEADKEPGRSLGHRMWGKSVRSLKGRNRPDPCKPCTCTLYGPGQDAHHLRGSGDGRTVSIQESCNQDSVKKAQAATQAAPPHRMRSVSTAILPSLDTVPNDGVHTAPCDSQHQYDFSSPKKTVTVWHKSTTDSVATGLGCPIHHTTELLSYSPIIWNSFLITIYDIVCIYYMWYSISYVWYIHQICMTCTSW